MRFWNLFAGIAVAAAVLLTGAVAEAKKKDKHVQTAQATEEESCPNPRWEEMPFGDRVVCVPPGLKGRFSPDFPPGLKGVPPPGWKVVSP
jgi:hypothetical protein